MKSVNKILMMKRIQIALAFSVKLIIQIRWRSNKNRRLIDCVSIIIVFMEKEPLVVSNKSCKAYFLVDGSKVYFSGDFDSGNL